MDKYIMLQSMKETGVQGKNKLYEDPEFDNYIMQQ